jgi:hypothetical protein
VPTRLYWLQHCTCSPKFRSEPSKLYMCVCVFVCDCSYQGMMGLRKTKASVKTFCIPHWITVSRTGYGAYIKIHLFCRIITMNLLS